MQLIIRDLIYRSPLISNVVMHGFTTAHAITAMALVQTVVGYEAALTTLTIITIVPLSKILLSFV